MGLQKIVSSPRSELARKFAVEGIFSAAFNRSFVRNGEIPCVYLMSGHKIDGTAIATHGDESVLRFKALRRSRL